MPRESGPPPLPYELRIGVTGHVRLADDEVATIVLRRRLADAIRRTVEHDILAPLEAASAEPFGPHGSPRRPLFRLMTRVAAWGTSVVCPPLERITSVAAASLRRINVPARGLPLRWPVVPWQPSVTPAGLRTPIDLTVVTSLAPGTDQIAARAICECVRDPESRNRCLEAVLPLQPERYEATFDRPADRAEFRALLALDKGRAATQPAPLVVRPHFESDRDPEYSSRPLEEWQAFQEAGRHVVEASEIVLAVWDPTRPARPGGTEETIRYAVEKRRVVLWLDPRQLDRAPRLLLSPREDGSDADQLVAPGIAAAPVPNRAKQLSRNFHRLAAYNRDAAFEAQAFRRALEAEVADLETVTSGSGLPDQALETLKADLLPHFVRADLMAARYHHLRDFLARLLPTISAAAVSLIAFQLLFAPHLYRLAGVEIALILVGYFSHRLSVHEAWHEKWLSDRHLTERLRDLVHTTLLSERMPNRPGALRAVNHLPFYRPTNDWFTSTLARLAARTERKLARDFDPAEHVHGLRELVRRGWVLRQARHHDHVRRREERAEHRAGRVTLVLGGAILLVALAHFFGVGHPHGETIHAPELERLDLWIGFLAVFLPAWGAAFQAVELLDDHPRMADRAGRMSSQLRGVAEQLRNASDLDEVRGLVSEARRVMELESHDFAESLRARTPRYHG